MAVVKKSLDTEVTKQVQNKAAQASFSSKDLKGFYAKIPEDMHTAFNKKALFEDDNVKNASDAIRKLIQLYLDGDINLSK